MFSRSNWNKFQPRSNTTGKAQQYSGFSTEDKYKIELERILQKKVPMSVYTITVNQNNYYVYLYQSQWNALRQILLHGHPFGFESMEIETLIKELRGRYPGIQSISNAIKTADILAVYISNGLTQEKINELSEYARNNAAAYAANGKLL